GRPGVEVRGQRRANRWVGLVNLEREAADRATIRAVGHHDPFPIAGEQREHALDWVVDPLPRGREQHLADAFPIALEYGEQEVLLAGKEVIEAAAVDARRLQQIGDAGR